MIRINLGKTRIEDAESLHHGGGFETAASSEATSQLVSIVVKSLLMFGGVIVIYYFENQNLSKLSVESAAATQQVQALQATLDQKNSELDMMGTAQQDSKVLEDKLKILKDLSHLRLREVKSLDYIQTVIPARAWLTELKIEEESYNIKGRARDAGAVSIFVRKLNDGGYFSDVVLVKDSPLNNEGVPIREFEIIAQSEVEN